MRFVGDRVAAVAAESRAIAEEALRLIEVEYEVLPAVFDIEQAMAPGAPVIHDEPDSKDLRRARATSRDTFCERSATWRRASASPT